MSETVFLLAYDGEAVSDGEMDVSDLAPALLGLGQVVKIAGNIVAGDHADVRLKVKTTKQGSFEVWLSLIFDGAGGIWQLLKTPEGQAATALAGILGFNVFGASTNLIKFVKWLGGRTPEKVERLPNQTVEVTIENVSIIVDASVYQMAFDPNLRAGLEKAVAEPLDKDGIEVVKFGSGPGSEVVRKSDRHAFRAPLLAEGDEFVSRHTRPFSIISLSFKHGQKWKLSDGHGSARSVTMSDEEFSSKVDRSEIRFAKGDVLICEVVERSRRTPTGFKSDYEIIKVLQHQPAPTSHPRFDDF